MFFQSAPKAPQIEVGPLLLRPFERADAQDYAQMMNQVLAQPGMSGFLLTFPSYFGQRHAQGRIRETHGWLRQNRGWSLAIELQGRMIGQAQIVTMGARRRLAEVAYWLGPAYQGQGHAQLAMSALIDAAVGHWPLERVEATVVPGNDSSTRLLDRLGFTYRELASVPYKVQGGWRQRRADLLIYERPIVLSSNNGGLV